MRYVSNADASIGASAPTNTVAFEGAGGGPVRVTGLANGTAANDAVNLGQVQSLLGGATPHAVVYTDASQDVMILGGDDGTTISNVAGGAVTADSTEAINGSQLFATNQVVQGNSAAIQGNSAAIQGNSAGIQGNSAAIQGNSAGIQNNRAAIQGNSAGIQGNSAAIQGNSAAISGLESQVGSMPVHYVRRSDPDTPTDTPTNTVAFDGATEAPVRVTGVANGKDTSDAVNLGQLQNGMMSMMTESKDYTDQRVEALAYEMQSLAVGLEDVSGEAFAGTASALAVSGIPQTISPHQNMFGGAIGHYRGKTAFAVGFSSASHGGGVVKLGGTLDSNGNGGVNAGAGFVF